MTRLGFLQSSATLAVGYAIAAALFWALVNVPESNVFALALSATLVLLIAMTVGITTGSAAALTRGVPALAAGQRAFAALPGFMIGLVIFAILWWLAGWVDTWWRLHRGEIDAVVLRYFGTSRTAPLHRIELWATWLLRWAVGLSVVAGLVVATTTHGLRAVGNGFGLSVRFRSLVAAFIGVVIVSEGLWRLVFWQPKGLAIGMEPALVTVKLVVLYGVAIAVAVAVLSVNRRAAD